MSFFAEFRAASAAKARQIIEEEHHLPIAAIAYVRRALEGFSGPVRVKVCGHLSATPPDQHNPGTSNLTIEVEPIIWREPKP